jgi:hypothetical protein
MNGRISGFAFLAAVPVLMVCVPSRAPKTILVTGLPMRGHSAPFWAFPAGCGTRRPPVQRVQLNARFIMDPDDCRVEGRDRLGTVLGHDA